MNNVQQVKTYSQRKISDFLFILWAGGAALLSYSLVYALRKPYTAAGFDGLEAFGMDYKVVVTIAQILGYVLSKFIGIKLISELKRENRMKFILISIILAEASLILFGLLPAPYNIVAMFLNGLSLGCMWGIIFSFIEGRRMTDILASLLGVSMVISSGTAKSAGLYVMDTLNISEFWMPALIGGVALPLLALLGYALNRLPQPTAEDIAMKSKRETLNGKQRWELFKNFMPFLTLLFIANVVLTILRDIKEDFLVKIIDVSSSAIGTLLLFRRAYRPITRQLGTVVAFGGGVYELVRTFPRILPAPKRRHVLHPPGRIAQLCHDVQRRIGHYQYHTRLCLHFPIGLGNDGSCFCHQPGHYGRRIDDTHLSPPFFP